MMLIRNTRFQELMTRVTTLNFYNVGDSEKIEREAAEQVMSEQCLLILILQVINE